MEQEAVFRAQVRPPPALAEARAKGLQERLVVRARWLVMRE
jgi:hypothetical protein